MSVFKSDQNQKFRDRASELIIKSNLTQSELKEALGVSAGTISDLKNQKSPPPNAETLYKLAKYFNVSADYLLGLSDVLSVDIDMKAVCDYTGLSQEAVELLKNNSDIDAETLRTFLDIRDVLGEMISIIKKN